MADLLDFEFYLIKYINFKIVCTFFCIPHNVAGNTECHVSESDLEVVVLGWSSVVSQHRALDCNDGVALDARAAAVQATTVQILGEMWCSYTSPHDTFFGRVHFLIGATLEGLGELNHILDGHVAAVLLQRVRV